MSVVGDKFVPKMPSTHKYSALLQNQARELISLMKQDSHNIYVTVNVKN